MSLSHVEYPESDRELGERILEWADELDKAAENGVILVEGKKDVGALHQLGIHALVIDINRGMNLFDLVERLRNGELPGISSPFRGTVIILTDWDSKGGKLASRLENAVRHFDLESDLEFRRYISSIVGKWIKDVESIPSYLVTLGSVVT